MRPALGGRLLRLPSDCGLICDVAPIATWMAGERNTEPPDGVLFLGFGAGLRVGSSMVEQRPFKALVEGSSPSQPTA